MKSCDYSKYPLMAFFLFVLTITFAGCCHDTEYPCNRDEVAPPDSAMKYIELSNSLKSKNEAVIQKIRKMNDKELYSNLQNDSLKGREPFNSMSFKEFLSRGSKSSENLYKFILEDARTSFLGIIALAEIDNMAYKRLDNDFVIKNLVATLEQSSSFNSWGLPHLYWEDAAKILIQRGSPAIKYLQPLLKNTKPAPVWGSEESMEYAKYQYRICDYAMALILEIKNQKNVIPEEIESRNEIIRSLLNDQ